MNYDFRNMSENESEIIVHNTSLCNEYLGKAVEFLAKTKSQLKIEFHERARHFSSDKGTRDTYNVYMENSKGFYKFKFGNSISETGTNNLPDAYDILSCLHVDYCLNFNDFCAEYGYDNALYSSRKTYENVKRESAALQRLFNEEELELLHEIS